MKTTLVFFVAFVLACFASLQSAHALSPAPDGCYSNFTTAEGCNALRSVTTGLGNTGIGWFSLFSNATGSFNTAVGAGALDLNTASNNTALGAAALLLNTTGSNNTAVGIDALVFNDGGTNNTAIGAEALFNNTSGSDNTADGTFALSVNDSGQFNTGIGFAALHGNTMGDDNTAVGNQALSTNSTGIENTAVGSQALIFNDTSNNNTAIGFAALKNNTADNNTAVGEAALLGNTGGTNNTAVGATALSGNTTGMENIALGTGAGGFITTGDSNIDIGNIGAPGDSNTIRIGNIAVQTATFIAGINGQVVNNGVAVFVDSNGKLGTTGSSARFKCEIKPMGDTSEAILALKPVTFRYKPELDPQGIPQFGLVAEDVEKVNPSLVARDRDGKVYTVRYEAVNAMLLNEFLKEHQRAEQQRKDSEAAIARQQKQIDVLTTGLQKVSAQLELNKAAPQTVLNNP